MSDRPVLNKHLDGDTFRSYYYLKEELTAFCRQNGIPASGGKLELTDRIAHFLDTGEISAASKKPKTKPVYTEITEDTLIEPGIFPIQNRQQLHLPGPLSEMAENQYGKNVSAGH